MKVFVYGTLRKGECRENVLNDYSFLGPVLLKGKLYDTGYYPAYISGEHDQVIGELYEIDEVCLSQLDGIEGYYAKSPEDSLYLRQEVLVSGFDGKKHTAFTYEYNQPVDDLPIIQSGDYLIYQQEKNTDSFWYIAYGSNMSSQRLMDRIVQPEQSLRGYLQGYQIIFNKIASESTSYANVIFTGNPDDLCPVVAYEMSNEQLSTLDYHEGVGEHYMRIATSFLTENNKVIPGQMYIAHPEKLIENCRPSKSYLDHILHGYRENHFNQELVKLENTQR